MKFVDEFRDAEACQRVIESIKRCATRSWSIMEVCGGQTHGLLKWGIDQQLKGAVHLLHGPGCPVCVTPSPIIDIAVSLSRRAGFVVTSFGDMLRVPGTHESLLQARSKGVDVRLVYSPLDAVRLAQENPHREIVFFAVGFETTAPATALAVKQAAHLGLDNFSLLVAHVRVLPAMELIASQTPRLVDGFLAAGHVCTVTGFHEYENFAAAHHLPVVVTGFEPLDLLRGIEQCVSLLEQNETRVVNCYERCVTEAGNLQAQGHMEDVFEVADREWRGFGIIPSGGLAFKPEWAPYDAAHKYSIGDSLAIVSEDCPAGEVMTGRLNPVDCPFFGQKCTPEKPMGAPMVSSEGACAAYFRYLPANHLARTSSQKKQMSQLPLKCPVPSLTDDVVTLAHGEGGRWTRRLIRERIVSRLGNIHLEQMSDAAVLPKIVGSPVITTDSYVVSPLFFPGGDIGKLAVIGTVNDLVVSGAVPKWITLSMIIEEGFPLSSLDDVLDSIAAAATSAQVQVVSGDTKVVPRGAADGIYLTTTGLGELLEPAPSGPATLAEGDVILVTGSIGQHGISILAARENLGFDPMPQSDCGSLWNAAKSLRQASCEVRAMRDATRGGVSAVLHEWADSSNTTIALDEQAVPVSGEVRGACELLGLDPLHLANEGTMVIAVPRQVADRALNALQAEGGCPAAAIIGELTARRLAPVIVRRGRFAEIPLEEPQGAPFPRICQISMHSCRSA